MYKLKIKKDTVYINYTDTNKIIIDTADLDKFLYVPNCKYKTPKWKLDVSNHLYTKNTNSKRVYLIDIIFNKKIKDKIEFIDENYLNFKINNIKIENVHNIDEKYDIIKCIPGHVKNIGKSAGEELNYGYEVIDININEDNDKPFFLMFCKPDTYTQIDKYYLDKIKYFNECELTWYLTKSGYIGAHYKENNKDKIIYLHQLITNWYGHGKGQLSIDHINQDKLDNRKDNLRIVNQSVQNQNTGKRNRKYNAVDLPNGIEQINLPKYVVYYKECYDKENNKWREFFKIEKHPKLNKPWISNKSRKVSIHEKLEQTKKRLYELDNDIEPECDNKLPLYINIQKFRNKDHLVFEKKEKNIRYNLKMVLKPDNFEKQLEVFKQKVHKKYNNINL